MIFQRDSTIVVIIPSVTSRHREYDLKCVERDIKPNTKTKETENIYYPKRKRQRNVSLSDNPEKNGTMSDLFLISISRFSDNWKEITVRHPLIKYR